MLLFSPSHMVSFACGFVAMGEEVGPSRGRLIDLMLNEVHEPANAPWSAAFVYHVGFWSHYDPRARTSSWPLPAYGRCDDLATFAEARGVLVEDDSPVHGDIFLQWSPARKSYVRAGIVVAKVGVGGQFTNGEPYIECEVVEGNSGVSGSLEGPSIVCITRRLSPQRKDRFIRWMALDPRLSIANPMSPFERAAKALPKGRKHDAGRAA